MMRKPPIRPTVLLAGVVAFLAAGPASAQREGGGLPDPASDPHLGWLTPLPDRGGVPPIVDLRELPEADELALRARVRDYERQIRLIRRQHFGSKRVRTLRDEGVARLREFVDPAAFRPMIEVLGDERDDVRQAVLDHFAAQGDEGQAALAWVAIMDEDDTMRREALGRMVAPPGKPVLGVLDQALRSTKHHVANNAGIVAGSLGALETIPLLIFAQGTRDPRPSDEGDLAWIAIQTQTAYVQNLQPVVGDNVGAFQPVVGVINEGVVLRVHDAVVIVYRTEIHFALVDMTTRDWGHSTEHLGYDMKKWWRWYNEEYVPFKNEQARLAGLARDPEEKSGG